jgi:hypothetical protein
MKEDKPQRYKKGEKKRDRVSFCPNDINCQTYSGFRSNVLQNLVIFFKIRMRHCQISRFACWFRVPRLIHGTVGARRAVPLPVKDFTHYPNMKIAQKRINRGAL